MAKKLLSSLFVVFWFIYMGQGTAYGQCSDGPNTNTSASISLQGPSSICSDETISFDGSVTWDGATGSLQWQEKIGSGDWNNISGETGEDLTNYSPQNNSRFRLLLLFCKGTADQEIVASNISGIITVVQVTTATASISADKTLVCPSESITFTASLTNQGSSPGYSWLVNGVQKGTSSTFSWNQFSDGDQVQLLLTSNRPCARDGDSDSNNTVESNILNISVKPATPGAPGSITGETQVCPNTPGIIYSINSVERATSYEWVLPSGWSGNSTTANITVTSGNVASNQIIKVKAINECGESGETTLAVSVGPGKPATPGEISDPGLICPGDQFDLNVPNDSGVESYTWVVPAGWNILSGNGSNTISVKAGNYGDEGTVSVYSTNTCQDSDVSSRNFSINEPAPSDPGNITGGDIVCPDTQVTYSIDPVNYADQYIWYFQGTEVSGQNGTSISINSGGSGDKSIRVIAVNECVDPASYPSLTGSTKSITVDDGTPGTATISQPEGSQNFCPGQEGIVFNIPTDARIDTYSWQVPAGWTITAGGDTSQITVTAGQIGDDGQITFTGSSNDCGSVTATYDVFVKNPAPVITYQTISGETAVCHSDSGLTYSIPEVQYATNYVWSVAGDWNIDSGQGSNTISVSAGQDDISISVYAENDCGQSSPVNLGITSIDGVPAQPTAISSSLWDTETNSNDPICPPASGITFSVPDATEADSYNWILPAGWEITSGANTSSITVKVTATANYNSSESIHVEAANICGASTRQTYSNIALSDYVQVDAGEDKTLCRTTTAITINGYVNFNGSKMKISPATSGSGSFTGVPSGKVDDYNFKYTPSQADIDNLDQVVITVTTEAPVGACGPGEDEMILFFRDNPSVFISGDATICSGTSSSLTFSGTPNTQVTYKVNGGTNQNITIGLSGEATLESGNLTQNTTYDLVSAIYTDAPACSGNISGSATITVTQIPTAEISYADGCTSETVLEASLTGTNNYSGGTFSGPSALSIDPGSGTINPSLSTPGTHTVTYTIPASGGCEAIDVTTEVKIFEKIVITSEPTTARACEGGNVQFEVTATGENLSYQWYKNSVAAGNEVGSNSNVLDLTNISAADAGEYLAVVTGTSPCSSMTSEPAELTVDENILIETQPEASSVCENGAASFSVSATSGGTPLGSAYTYQWFKGDPGTGTPVSGATSANLEINPAVPGDSGNYYVEISGPADYQCEPVISEAAILTVRETARVEISGDAEICSGTSTEITFSNGLPNGIVTYTVNNNNTSSQTFALDASGAGVLNTGTLVATSGTDTEFVYAVQSVAYADAPECSTSVSGSVTVTVAPDPDVSLSFAGDQTEFCTADTDTYIPVLEGTGTYNGGIFSASGITLNQETGAFVPANQNPGNYTITYTIPAYGGCGEKNITLDISIFEEVKITSQPYNVGICSTQDAEFFVSATGDDLKYQWFKNGNPIAGAESATLSLPVATSEDAGEYFVRISGTNACTPTEETMVDSDAATLNVDEDIVIIEPAEDISVCETGDETVKFRFVAHANGAPLKFTWIYSNGQPVPIDGTKIIESPVKDTIYGDLDFPAYTGTLTIKNIVEADENMYAVQIDGSENGFTCPTATSNSFKLEVDPLPNSPVVENIEYCLNEEAVALTATGSDLLWYESPDDDTPSETAPVPSTTAVGEFTYYVSQTSLYCESELAEITVTVNDRPAAPGLTTAEKNIEFCLGETATALTATPEDGATLNWYDTSGSTTPLDSAPVPPTNAAGSLQYWVSQTNSSGCEGDREVVTVQINNLPAIVPPDDVTICSGDTIEVAATDTNQATTPTTYTWNWESNSGEPLSGSTVNLQPDETTTYTITGTNESGCVNTAQFTISVDDRPVGGIIVGPESVCITDPSGELTLTGSEGDISRWEYQIGTSGEWTSLENTTTTYDFTALNISENAKFRAVLSNGVCEEVFSQEHLIIVDPEPVAGRLLFNGTDRVFMMCEFPTDDYLVPLQTIGEYTGDIVAWHYRRNSDTAWRTVKNSDGSNYTGPVLSGQQVITASNNESTIFRVEVQSGACTPNVLSETATLSIIPSDIAPNPVSAAPGEICLGDTVSLSSGTGYGGNGVFEGGAFDNSSIANHGWRVKRFDSNTEYTFESSADNTRPERWMRTNPKEFSMANPNGSGTIKQLFDSSSGNEGNKGFAIVSGNNPSTLETPVFNTYTMDNPTLTFDQAYNLTPGDTIKVQISLDGGNTYIDEPLFVVGGPAVSGNYASFGDGDPASRPNNKMVIDLSQYAGLANLRIRWLYDGSTGGIYTIDDIGIPQDPDNVQLIWYHDEDLNDPNNPLDQIGEINQGTVTFTPEKIGWNYFEVQTALIFDTNGDPCQSAENFATIQVYVFDTYTSTATAEIGSCGDSSVQLSGVIEGASQGVITEFPVDDESTVTWEVIESPEGYNFAEEHFIPSITDPNAVFNPGMGGEFIIQWTITPDGDSPCEPTQNTVTFEILDCTTLDFDGIDDYVDLGTSYTGNYFIEAWIRPEESTGTIISGPDFEIKMEDLPSDITPNSRWYHIAASNNGDLYVDGLPVSSSISGTGGSSTLIGARWNSSTKEAENHFSGWIEEVRIWNKPLNVNQIRFMMNQRLTNNGAEMGEQIPMPVPDGLTYSDLAGYYRLISADPDPANLISFDANLMPDFGLTPDLALNEIPGRLHNMTTNQQNTAPLPYISAVDGQTWATDNTWIRPEVWDTPNSTGITGDPINWNIAITRNHIDSGNKDITLLGLKSEVQDKLITMANPSSPMNEKNSGQMMRVTHYLLLDGNMDLVGESQLLQDEGSILAEESAGWLERDQQGKRLSFNYNYWSSPVSAQGAANNANYTVSQVLLDGTDSNNPKNINFDDRYHAADKGRTTPITISNYWIWKFLGTADVYEEWFHIGSTGTLATGEGYTMKGTDGTVGHNDEQNYVFKGKPHNGDFTRVVSKNQNYLIGNPYPSAMDAAEFILDNMKDVNSSFGQGRNDTNIFNGALYYWDHFAGKTHYLERYIGGYATWTLAGGVVAISNDERINANDQEGTKEPGQYIPVAQGFFVNTVLDDAIAEATGITVSGGPIEFKNRQRIYQREAGNSESIFHTQEKKDVKGSTSQSSTKETSTDIRQKIWLKFKSPMGYHRQLLVTADPNTSNGFDLGYDAPMIEDNEEDMYWYFSNYKFVIQAVKDFNVDQELPLGMKIHESGKITISIDNLKNIPDDMEIFLKDSLLQVNHDLRKQQYITTSDTGAYHNRFKVIFKDPTAVVVEEPEVPESGEFEILYVNGSREILVKNPELLHIERIYLNNILGQQLHVYYDVPAEKELRLPVKRFSSGVYIVKVHSEKGIRTKKVILE